MEEVDVFKWMKLPDVQSFKVINETWFFRTSWYKCSLSARMNEKTVDKNDADNINDMPLVSLHFSKTFRI